MSHWNDGDKKTREFWLRINENAHSHENSSRSDSETMLNKTYNYTYYIEVCQYVCVQPFKKCVSIKKANCTYTMISKKLAKNFQKSSFSRELHCT